MGLVSSSYYVEELSDSDSSSDESISNYYSEDNEMKGLRNFAKDAATLQSDSNNPQLKPERVLNLEKLRSIESSLEPYEIVSLVYLLYEEPHYALQELNLWLCSPASKKLLYDWASLQKNRNTVPWQEKVIEALCIIQNYQVLKQLGFKKHDLICQYLPCLETTALYINKQRKVLYLICEQMDQDTTYRFLNMMKSKTVNMPSFKEIYLELYFLFWEAERLPLNEIRSVLKIMDLDVLYRKLEKLIPSPSVSQTTEHRPIEIETTSKKETKPKPRQPSTSIDTHYRDDIPSNLMSYPSISGESSVSESEEFNSYEVDPKNPGTVLIINQEDFYTEMDPKFVHLLPSNINQYKLESRLGTVIDRDMLQRVFMRYGFKVIVENNLIHSEMVDAIRNVVDNIRNESSLFVCILSHGNEGVIYGVNSCKVDVNMIQDIMCKTNKDNLVGKPKFLILQSCQGTECQKIEEEEPSNDKNNTTDGNKQAVPSMADMLTFWATVPGFAAIRNKRSGSWFIQTLCQKMEEIGSRYHFADICTRIINDVAKKKWTDGADQNVMTPMIMSTLRKNFYLPSLKEGQ